MSGDASADDHAGRTTRGGAAVRRLGASLGVVRTVAASTTSAALNKAGRKRLICVSYAN